MKFLAAALFAALAIGAVAPSLAEGTSDVIVVTGSIVPGGATVRSKTISYADLDVSKPAGVKTLLSRIEAAAREVCAPKPSPTDSLGTADYQKCVKHAVDTAVAQVNNSDLTAMVASVR